MLFPVDDTSTWLGAHVSTPGFLAIHRQFYLEIASTAGAPPATHPSDLAPGGVDLVDTVRTPISRSSSRNAPRNGIGHLVGRDRP